MQPPPGPPLARDLPARPRRPRAPDWLLPGDDGPGPDAAAAADRPFRPPGQPAPYGRTFVPASTDPVPEPWNYERPADPPQGRERPADPPRPPAPADWLEPPAPDERLPEAPAAPRAQERPGRRLGRSLYDAEDAHGNFGLVDTGQVCDGVRVLVAHVPRGRRGYHLDLRAGGQIHANSARGDHAVGGRLDVVFVTRHKYYAPGRAVTSCLVGVPDRHWLGAFGA